MDQAEAEMVKKTVVTEEREVKVMQKEIQVGGGVCWADHNAWRAWQDDGPEPGTKENQEFLCCSPMRLESSCVRVVPF